MLDVHPPHSPTHTWNDFFIHIATIVVGLLIAVGLEQSVEAIHHHSERVETRDHLREEIADNQTTLEQNLKNLASEEQMLQTDIDTLRQLREHHAVSPDSLHFNWQWSSMSDSAWQTAREAIAIPLFPTPQIEAYSTVFAQQALVNGAGIAVSHGITEAATPLRIEPKLSALTPAQIDELLRSCAQTLNQIEYTQSLASTLGPMYKKALDTL